MKKRFRHLFPLLLVALVALGIGAATVGGPLSDLQGSGLGNPTKVLANSSLVNNPYLIADVAERVTPAVVYIEVTHPAPERRSTSPFSDPFFRDFFWPFFPWPDQGPRPSRGSGFIIDEEGHILTNQHVVGDPGAGQKVVVKLDTGDFKGEVEAQILGSDYLLDLAVLKIEKPEGLERLPTIPLGDSDASRPGEWVIAIGNPYGEQFEHTVTVGVLSAKGRKIEIYDRERGRTREYSNLMQTDAAINPGNSGGPLINIQGEAIGINTAVNAQAQGIGFAIPINTALEIKDQLINDGKVARAEDNSPFLGIEFSDVDERIAQALRLPEAKGVVVVGVLAGTAAQEAGLRVYDVIQYFDDIEIDSSETLVEAIQAKQPGDEVLMVVWRQGSKRLVPVTLGARGQR